MALTERETHFDFGENWQRFAAGLTQRQIEQAVRGLEKLVGPDVSGRTFLEIGCGSGIHSLAALRLGVRSVSAVDIDSDAVAAARAVLSRHAPGGAWRAEVRSVFDLPSAPQYDIVYSWGVLHHTGDLWRAVERAAALTAPGGRLVLAIYRRTPLCGFWRREKRLYAHGPRWYRRMADSVLASLLVAGLLATGRNPVRYIRDYARARGMAFLTDIRDWLGGYPYESAAPDDVRRRLTALAFAEERFFPCRTRIGLLGVGCDEYVFRRR